MSEVFLLGGCDLEMCVIRKLLEKNSKKYYDKKLAWGAKLSDYKEEIERHKHDTIYAIELTPDIPLKKNIKLIDHHNERYAQKSALEQIADILGCKLNGFKKAVALNDKGYIDAMIKNNINIHDIKRIRKLDRKCQGVTDEAEKAAENVKLERIMKFDYRFFSPLTDRVYFEKGWKKFIIYNDYQVMFYGFDIEKLRKTLEKHSIFLDFWGGGLNGFAGVNTRIERKILEKIYNELKDPVSHHIFMFPFVINKKSEEEYEKFEKLLNEKDWENVGFKLERVEYYNEYVYFYEHVRDVLYGFSKDISVYREKKINPDESRYIIKLINGKIFELEIEDISLRIFNKAIGILSFHLNNYDYDDPDDILAINEYGRRIFPQFLDKKEYVLQTKKTFLADEISIIINKEKISEDFSAFEKEKFKVIQNNENIKETVNKLLIPKFITHLVGDNIKLVLDDRMFTVCFYFDKNAETVKRLQNYSPEKYIYSEGKIEKISSEGYGYLNDEWWYRYLFVDCNTKTCQSREMCPQTVKKSTYDRWVDYGTLWGVSRYSFVGLSSYEPMKEIFMTHTKTMYYQMTVLLLMYKTMMVYFSDKVQDIVEKYDNRESKNKLRDESKKLYTEYLKFLNGLYFKDITSQEQGIELYKKALNVFEIENQIKDFDREMNELDNLIEIEVESERNKDLEKLNKIATLFLPPTFIAGFAGMNVGYFDDAKGIKFIIIMVIMAVSVLLSSMIIENKKLGEVLNDYIIFFRRNKKIVFWSLGLILVCLIILGIKWG